MNILDVQQILLEYQELFSTFSNVFLSAIRFVGWWLIRGLTFLNEKAEEAFQVIFGSLDFFNTAEVGFSNSKGLYSSLLPIFWSLLVIGVIMVGYMLMTNRLQNKAQIPTNLILIVIVVVGMPSILNMLNDVTQVAVGSLSSTTTFMDDMIRSNVTDLDYLDKNNFSADAVTNKNNFPKDGSVPVRAIVDPMETINYKDANNKELFQSELKIASDGTVTVEKNASKNILGMEMLDKLYYRYQVNWFILIVTAFVLLLAIIMCCVKTGRNIFEIAYSGILMLFIAPLDITSGQRTKKIIQEIINLFAVIVLTLILFRLYSIGMTWTGTLPWFPALLMQIAFSSVMIGGPNIVVKVLGLDLGVGKEMQTAASVMYMADTANRTLRGGAHAVGNVVKGAAQVAGGAGVIGAAGAGAVTAGIKNAAAEHKARNTSPPQTPADYTILGAEGKKGAPVDAPALNGEKPVPGLGDGKPKHDRGDDLTGSGVSPHGTPPPFDGDGGAASTPDADGAHDVHNPDAAHGQTEGVMGTAGGKDDADGREGLNTQNDKQSDKPHPGNAPPPPSARRITREDTFGSALGKMAGSTKAAGAAKSYGAKVETAFQVGQNSMNKAWENQKNTTPHVYAEPVDDPRQKSPADREPPEPIIINNSGAREGNTRPGISHGNKPDKGGERH